jgi:DNA (cytosine-5)-methyltransferase 1
MTATEQFSFVDLFAGCGGLSLGLRSAGGVEILAVERAKDAAHTFFANFLQTGQTFEDFLALPHLKQIEHGLLAESVETLLALQWKPTSPIDVVVGGPPCQGFSLAGRRDSSDTRNDLVWRFLDVVESLDPKIVVIENVEGMNQRFAVADDPSRIDAESTFAQVLLALQGTGDGYVTFGLRVNAMHFGAAQHRPRLMALGIRAEIARALGLVQEADIWSSNFEGKGQPAQHLPVSTVQKARTVADAIGDLASKMPVGRSDVYLADLKDLFSVWTRTPESTRVVNNEKRTHRPTTRTRFRVLQMLSQLGANPRLLGPMSEEHRAEATEYLRSVLLKKKEFRFKSEELVLDTESFLHLVGELANNKHSQRALKWDAPARTVMTIPDDHVHPDEPRTFTVREMARFQGFPDNFVFKGKATTGGTSRRTDVPQYSQVGNAVSPFVGRAVGEMIVGILEDPRVGKALGPS